MEEIIEQLAGLVGQPLKVAGGMCDVMADGHALTLRADEKTGAWTIVGVMGTLPPKGTQERADVMDAALQSSFLGRWTGGLQLGIFGDALMVSDTIEGEQVTAETLASRILEMTTQIDSMIDYWHATYVPAQEVVPEQQAERFEGQYFLKV